jgi:hypothetical protein
MIKEENRTLPEIAKQLLITKDNFKKLLSADTNSSARTHMMHMYIDFSEKRIDDLKFIEDKFIGNRFFAGSTEEYLFKVIQLRDKVSQDVLESKISS